MDQAHVTGTVKLSKVMGECRTQRVALSSPGLALPTLPDALQVGPCHEKMPFCDL